MSSVVPIPDVEIVGSGSGIHPSGGVKRQSNRYRCASLCHEDEQNDDKNKSILRSSENCNTHQQSCETSGKVAHCHDDIANKPIKQTINNIDKEARKKLIIASTLCLIFMLAEIIGGIVANSLAIATDAAHLLTDFASFMISIFSLYLASRPATKKMSFGWHRAEVMGALISVLLIWVVTAILVYMAIQRVISKDFEINASIMLITAGLGVIFNIIMAFSLHDAGHGHSHGGGNHSHISRVSENDTNNRYLEQTETSPLLGSAQRIGGVTIDSSLDSNQESIAKKENINVRAAFIHVIGDFIQSVGILIAAYIIYYKPEWKLADPICTFFFSILVLFTTITILKDVMNVLMEGMPHGINFNDVKKSLCDIEGVRELHNMRIWSLTINKIAVSVHLVLEKDIDSQKVLYMAGRMLKSRYSMHECTIQIEEYVEQMDDCQHCKDPKD